MKTKLSEISTKRIIWSIIIIIACIFAVVIALNWEIFAESIKIGLNS